MALIDAHQHYWDPARCDYGWLTPDKTELYRGFGPADLAGILARQKISGTILVQAAPTLAETDYLLGIADATPSVLGVVGWIDFENPGHKKHLARFARHPKFKGVRPMIQDIADPAWMLRPELSWAFEALSAHELAFDALVLPRHLPALRLLLARHPALRAVIDHGAKPDIKGRAFAGWAGDMARIAGETGAFVKLSDPVTEAGADWRAADLSPYSAHLIEAFGPGRVMFGSDRPVCLNAASYENWFAAARELTKHLTPDEQTGIFGAVARAFYRPG